MPVKIQRRHVLSWTVHSDAMWEETVWSEANVQNRAVKKKIKVFLRMEVKSNHIIKEI